MMNTARYKLVAGRSYVKVLVTLVKRERPKIRETVSRVRSS